MKDIPEEILMSAAEGNIDAFERIYKETSGFVYSVSLRMCRNQADAEEITQDVFMKAYRGLKKFNRSSSLKTWIYRITVNTALNHCRTTRASGRNRVHTDDIDSAASDTSAVESARHSDRGVILSGLLEKLSPEYRACLVLREIEGLSYREIAEGLRIPVNTVRSRLVRARATLLREARKEVSRDEL